MSTCCTTYSSNRQQYFNKQARESVFDFLVTILQFEEVLTELMQKLNTCLELFHRMHLPTQHINPSSD